MKNKSLVLIDGSSFVHRAYYALPNLKSPQGKPTGAIFGMINMIKQLQSRYPDSYFVCFFDVGGKTFRDEIHEEYKSNRKPMPTDLKEQLKYVYDIIEALGIHVIRKEGVEADDLIGSLAIRAKKRGLKVIIATSDKDFTQLVDDDIILVNTMNNEILDVKGVKEKFGVLPEQIIDYLSLVGDASDNIKGVEKCGPKTAKTWLSIYKNLDNIIEHSEEIKGVVGENLRKSLKWLKTAKELVTIKTDFDISAINDGFDKNFVDLKPKDKEEDKLKKYFEELGFKTWFNALSIKHSTNLSVEKVHSSEHIDYIENIEQIETLLHIVKERAHDKKNVMSIFILRTLNNKIDTIKYICIHYNNKVYFIKYLIKEDNELITEDSIIEKIDNYYVILNKILTSEIQKIVCDYKTNLHLLKNINVSLSNVVGDIFIANYVKDSQASNNILSIISEYLSLHKTSEDFSDEDCTTIVSNLNNIHEKILKSFNDKELTLYQDVELPLAKILYIMETNGIMIDVNKFKSLESKISLLIYNLMKKIHKECGEEFNINSTQQLSNILFNRLNIPTDGIKKNINAYSTDEESLKKIERKGYTIVAHILEYRNLSKLLNTYVSKLPKLVSHDNRLHTTFLQTIVATGRLSSVNPNLQNIPIKNELGKEIRSCFIASKGYSFICADYSQIELRILAHFSNDQHLIKAFEDNLDIHKITASEIFGKPLSDVTDIERSYGKIINFSIIYGKTVYGLSNELNVSKEKAKEYIDAYFNKFSQIRDFLDTLKVNAKKNGYVETLLGRKIYINNIDSKNKGIREAAMRFATNAPMQGSCSDIIKLAMIRINNFLEEKSTNARLLLQIHDELIIECPQDKVHMVKSHVTAIMTEIVSLKVPLKINIIEAKDWEQE